MIIGPLLSRFGKASIPKPGGDKIGRRKLDTHFEGLVKLGANFKYDNKNYRYNVTANKLKGFLYFVGSTLSYRYSKYYYDCCSCKW